MADYIWDDLKKYWIGNELWLESDDSHWAVLTARAMHDERENASEVPVDPPADPAPTKKGK
jgi:hypothetical protein